MLRDDIARTRKYWQPVIQAMISAADWGGKYADEVEPFLAQLAQKEELRPLSAIFQRIIAGERNPDDLLTGLDATGMLVAGDVLRAMGVEIPVSLDPSQDEEDLTPVIEDLIQKVAYAARPETPLVYSEQMYEATNKMANHPKLQPELRELGRVLNLILSGERNPDLSVLSPRWSLRVREILSSLADPIVDGFGE